MEIFLSFGWFTALPKGTYDTLAHTLTSYSFTKQKKIIWMHMIRASYGLVNHVSFLPLG